MTIRANGEDIEESKLRANFHLTASDDEVAFFLPTNEVERRVCLEESLPRRFMIFLEVTDPLAHSVLGTVFREDNQTVIEKVLGDVGITYVTFKQQQPTFTSSRQTPKPTTPAVMRITQTPVTPERGSTIAAGMSRCPSLISGDQDASYAETRKDVVRAAERRAAQDTVRISPEVIQHGFGSNQWDRANRIGAAGELYVGSYSFLLWIIADRHQGVYIS